jgi:phosphoribosylanthranilate isomerase
MLRIKICGITNPEDLNACIEAGVDEIGFIFYPESKRYVEPETVSALLSGCDTDIGKVGVFVNESIDTVLSIAGTAGLDTLQLHGDEDTDYCSNILIEVKGTYRILKAFSIVTAEDVKSSIDFISSVNSGPGLITPLYDTKTPGYGGSGKSFDWSLLKGYQDHLVDYYLSGGLDIHNIGRALDLLNPSCVDISSGVENFPGQKDRNKIFEIINYIRSR